MFIRTGGVLKPSFHVSYVFIHSPPSRGESGSAEHVSECQSDEVMTPNDWCRTILYFKRRAAH